MTGDADYQLRIVVKSLIAFEDFANQADENPGNAQVMTSFALRPRYTEPHCPFDFCRMRRAGQSLRQRS